MGGERQRDGAALLLSILILAVAAFPRCSAAAAAKSSPPKKQKGWSPPPPSPPSVDVGGARRPFSSTVFPIYGNVHPLGVYYVEMNIGEPPKPYFLDVDTGSELTWLQCDAPCVSCSKGPHPWYRPSKSKLVPCKDPLCASLRSSTHQRGPCQSPTQCDYDILYADRGSSLGVLLSDAFALQFTNGSRARPRLAFGCGYDQQGLGAAGKQSPTDGVLGLGSASFSVPSQLHGQGIARNMIGHCLSRRGGFLFFGDDFVPHTGVTWAPMLRNVPEKRYSLGPAKLVFGAQPLGVKEIQVVFDSGSSYTYLALAPYQALVSAVKKDLSGKPLKEAKGDPTLPLCWKGPKPFKSLADVRKYFKSLVLSFVNGNRALLEVPPQNYLIISEHGNVCFGILNGTQIGLKENIIGDISLQDLIVVYDNERQQIGWTSASCDRLPNADENGGFEDYFYQPQFASMGVLTEECPASYISQQLYFV